jgi:phosphoadenosine phosphosulfate reductase
LHRVWRGVLSLSEVGAQAIVNPVAATVFDWRPSDCHCPIREDAMLIPSPRHTASDLTLWAEYERGDFACDVARLQRMEAEAVKCIQRFADDGPCYVSISGGKDSSVLWAVAQIANRGLQAWHLDTQPLADPHIVDVFAHLNQRFPMPINIVRNWCRKGDDGQWHATGTFESGMAEVNQTAGTHRYICGVRAEESGVRRISCRHLGKTTNVSCRPLAWWTAQDIYSYSAIRGVPLHPNYAMMGGGRWDRSKLRVAFLGLTHGANRGRAEWEREYYGDVLNKITMLARS